MPRTNPSELTISVTTRPQPPRRFTSRRKAVSVIPAMGASANDGATSTLPIFISLEPSERFHIGGIDFDADRLTDQIHRKDKPRVGALAHQPSMDALQRTMGDLDQRT